MNASATWHQAKRWVAGPVVARRAGCGCQGPSFPALAGPGNMRIAEHTRHTCCSCLAGASSCCCSCCWLCSCCSSPSSPAQAVQVAEQSMNEGLGQACPRNKAAQRASPAGKPSKPHVSKRPGLQLLSQLLLSPSPPSSPPSSAASLAASALAFSTASCSISARGRAVKPCTDQRINGSLGLLHLPPAAH